MESQATPGASRYWPGAGGRAERPGGAVPSTSPSLGITLAPVLQGILQGILPPGFPSLPRKALRKGAEPSASQESRSSLLAVWLWVSDTIPGLLLPASPHQKPQGYEKVLARLLQGPVTGLTSREGCDAL